MISQIIIAVTGVLAIWLSQDLRYDVRKWSPVVAIIGQPFWFIAMYSAEQYIILVLCGFYTASWLKGLYNYWGKTICRFLKLKK